MTATTLVVRVCTALTHDDIYTVSLLKGNQSNNQSIKSVNVIPSKQQFQQTKAKSLQLNRCQKSLQNERSNGLMGNLKMKHQQELFVSSISGSVYENIILRQSVMLTGSI